MQSKAISGQTRVCGKRQGYIGLSIRDKTVVDHTDGASVNSMTSAWEPMPPELVRLMAGAAVEVMILGDVPPPMLVSVGPPPEQPASHVNDLHLIHDLVNAAMFDMDMTKAPSKSALVILGNALLQVALSMQVRGHDEKAYAWVRSLAIRMLSPKAGEKVDA